MSLVPNLDEMTDEQKLTVLESVHKSIAQSKEIQKKKIAENVEIVVQALKKIENDIRSRFDDVGNAIETRVASIKDGRDGIDGKDGRDGKDGKNGKDGKPGRDGKDGLPGKDGADGKDGVSVSSAYVDFDGSLIILLDSGKEINVGEVIAPDLAEKIKVITNGGGTSQSVIDALANLQAQIDALSPSTGTVSLDDGSASSPSLNNVGDTNTGLFFPDEDTIAFTEGGVESMRINSSGYLGIGTQSPTTRLHVSGAGGVASRGTFESTSATTGAPPVINFYRSSTTSMANQFVGQISFIRLLTDSSSNTAATITAFGSNIAGSAAGTIQSDVLTDYRWLIGGAEQARLTTTGLGIGTASPFGKLDVNGITGAGANSFLVGFGVNGDNYYTSGSSGIHVFRAAGTERMRVDASGNLGLGVTPSAWTVGRVLQIANVTGTFLYGAGGQSILGTNSYYDTSWKYAGTGNATYYEQTSGSHNWFTAPSGTAGNAITFTQAMTLNVSGNLGIGTASPANRLDIVSSASSAQMSIAGSDGQFAGMFGGTGSNGPGIFFLNTAPALRFGTATTKALGSFAELMRLTAGGNLGLGVTPSAWGPTQKAIQVSTVGSVACDSATVRLVNNAYFDGTNWVYLTTTTASRYQQTSGIHSWFTAPSGTAGNAITFTTAMTLDASGNLGIGTTSAGDRLSLGGAIRVTQDGSSVGVYLAGGMRHTGSTAFYIDSNTGGAAGNIIFRNGSGFSEQMRLDSSGRLAIGETSAQGYRLNVKIANTSTTLLDGDALRLASSASGADVNINFTDGVANNAFIGMVSGNLYFYTNLAERMRLDTSGNLGIGTASPVNKLQVVGSFGRGAPVTKTGDFTLAATENWIICNGTGTITVTLPAASSWTGREFTIKTIAAFTVISNASNVVPLAGGAAGTAILAATAGTWATLVSDGTNWIIMQA
jgi:hypothetical protein